MHMRWRVGLCIFIVPRCGGLRVGAEREPAGRCVFGEDRWPSASLAFGLTRSEARFSHLLHVRYVEYDLSLQPVVFDLE